MKNTGTIELLAVEDDELNRTLLAEIMTIFGHNLDLAPTGTNGLQKLKTNDYDAVLTDCQLPDIGGDQIAEAAKEKHPDIPVIMVTASDIYASPDRPPPHVDRIVPKPYNVKELNEVITAAVRKEG